MNRPASRGRIIELDGLRGLAALAVVLAHYIGEVEHHLRIFALGWAGVVLFFVLSGFLVGGILMDNRDASNFFSAFYARRALRIFPIYYIVLAILLIFSNATRTAPWADPHFHPLAYVFYAQNVFYAFSGADGRTFQPLWTLAVEEQFYLLVPLVVYFCPPRLLVRVIVAGVIVAPILRLLFLHSIGALVLLPCRWDALLLGMLVAIAQRDHRVRARLLAHLRAVRLVAFGCLFLVPALEAWNTALFRSIGLLALAAFVAIYLFLVVNGTSEAARFRANWLRAFGRISYGLYLIHQPVSYALHGLILGSRPDFGSAPEIAVTLAAVAMSIALASLSWVYVEAPLLRMAPQWAYRTRLVAAPSYVPDSLPQPSADCGDLSPESSSGFG